MTRTFLFLTAAAAALLLGACDSHSWEKTTSQLFHKKDAHGSDHAAPAAHGDAHAKPAEKAHH